MKEKVGSCGGSSRVFRIPRRRAVVKLCTASRVRPSEEALTEVCGAPSHDIFELKG